MYLYIQELNVKERFILYLFFMCNALFVSAVYIYTFNNIILACDKEGNEKCFSVKRIIKSEYQKNLSILFAQILLSRMSQSLQKVDTLFFVKLWYSVFSYLTRVPQS